MESPGWQELLLLAGVAPAWRGPDGTATEMTVPGFHWKCMNRNPSFGVKHTEKHETKLFGCSGTLGYIPTSSSEGCLVQEASVSWGGCGGNKPSEWRSVPLQPQGSSWRPAQLPYMTVSDGAQGSLVCQDAGGGMDSAPKIHMQLQEA